MHGKYTVVVGVDFTREGELALREAYAIARKHPRAVVHAVHVDAVPRPLRDSHIDLEVDRHRLEDLCAQIADGPRPCIVPHVRLGSADREIVELAVEKNADLVVIGTHERSTFQRMVLGSIGDHIVHEAPCSVLVARAHA
jgi:nucleotide-binding universal stress UspA family protein